MENIKQNDTSKNNLKNGINAKLLLYWSLFSWEVVLEG